MKIIGIIPARYESTRYPGKPLIDIGGKTMIQRVYERALLSKKLSMVIVATDDVRIADHVSSFGGHFAMTSDEHQSGTDRCAEVIQRFPDTDITINIQGDEPFIDPSQIDSLAVCFENKDTQIATLVKKIETYEELVNINTPKVLRNVHKQAIYFSRSPIPFIRGVAQENWLQHFEYYKHIGVYAYRNEVLKDITKLKPSALELAEGLEQLRWIEHGYKIATCETDMETLAVDTPEDLQRILKIAKHML
ncbi:3-deoxy-manno-octulosonate cytidylyltransferase [Olivibacter sitiensis]|uniref:3-deoxy-manno-octulosonate cytidylyltransferase n=1 Tax=Olivibacter sitiensis TaxID=376470 RepID=UPI000416D94F|nr:3-deoxy-manno-octulosonate cytidylyltransferase [Olivibacter sitiensis]